MKIGLVCPYNILKGGGVQEVVLALQAEFLARGHDVKIITPRPWDHSGTDMPGVIFVGMAADWKSPFHTTAQVSVSLDSDELDDVLAQEQFDVLHFHEPWVPVMSRQLLTKSRSVNIATFHAKMPGTVMSKTIERVITPYTKSVMKYLHELTAVSDVAAEYVRGITDRNVSIVPNGIDLKKYQQIGRSFKPKPYKTILYVGRLEKRKGVVYLLKAFAALTEHQPDKIRLLIAGDGPERSKLEAFVEDNVVPNVRFLGYIDDAEKLRLLHEADVFCSPATFGESFGIVLLEAMAAGAVVLAGDNAGYSDLLKERGRLSLVNVKRTKEFVQRLELLLYDTELRGLWKQWAAVYVQQFDYGAITDSYLRVYQKALAEHQAGKLAVTSQVITR